LARARAPLAEAGLAAEFKVRDVWAEPEHIVDGVFTGFWISHVDRARLDEFFVLAATWLAPGGLLAFIDSRADPESGARDHRPPEETFRLDTSTVAGASGSERSSTSRRISSRRWDELASTRSR
jgi:predicted methyltransferase